MPTLTVGVDVGGTKVMAGAVDAGGHIVAVVRRPTPGTDPLATAEAIAAVVAELRVDRDIEAVGVGAAGFVDENRSVVRFAPTWPGGRSRCEPS